MKNRNTSVLSNHSKTVLNNFNSWISTHFKGLSAFTLVQLLKMETPFPHAIIEDDVYVDLFNFFCGKDTTENTRNKFEAYVDFVACVTWL